MIVNFIITLASKTLILQLSMKCFLVKNGLVWFGLLGFMAYQPSKVIWRQIHFYVNKQFYFKQFSLAWVHSLIVKNISISNYSSSYI